MMVLLGLLHMVLLGLLHYTTVPTIYTMYCPYHTYNIHSGNPKP